MGNLFCMGLILRFRVIPSPGGLNRANHSLPAGMHMDVLDRDFLLTLASVAIECVQQDRISPAKFIRLAETLTPTFEGLFRDHGSPVAFHGSIVSRD